MNTGNLINCKYQMRYNIFLNEYESNKKTDAHDLTIVFSVYGASGAMTEDKNGCTITDL